MLFDKHENSRRVRNIAHPDKLLASWVIYIFAILKIPARVAHHRVHRVGARALAPAGGALFFAKRMVRRATERRSDADQVRSETAASQQDVIRVVRLQMPSHD